MRNGFAEKKETFMAIKNRIFQSLKKSHFSRETRLTRTQIFGSVTQPILCLVVSCSFCMPERIMWLRQEYKPEKQRFEKPFELEVDDDHDARRVDGKNQAFSKKLTLKLEQSYAALETTVWDGSIALAKMFDSREIFPVNYLQKCKILELGAGCGLVGIYLCLLGVKMSVLTDQQCCIETLEHNVAMNISDVCRSKIKVLEYSWGNSTSELTIDGLFDLVLAAEVLYSPTDSKLLAQCIPRLTHKKSKIFISMGRNRGGEEVFVKTMREQGYLCEEVRNIENNGW